MQAGQQPQVGESGVQSLSAEGVFSENYQLFPTDQVKSQAFAQRFPVFNDSEISFLNPGADFYNARIKLLDQATQSVRIQYLLFQGDESGWKIAQKLVELKKRGVRVNVIIDDLSNYSLKDQRLYFYLRNNGIDIQGWEFLFLNIIGRNIKVDDFGVVLDDANQRYHDKLFIIDGDDPIKGKAIIGGANIGNNYFRIEKEVPEKMWHDSEVMIRGSIVRKMAQIFDENLEYFRSERSFSGSSEDLWSVVNAIFKVASIPDSLNTSYLLRLDQIVSKVLSLDWHHAPMRFIQSRPRKNEDYIHPIYLDLINKAKEEILINHSYFVPDESFINALYKAALRGVKIYVMTNTKDSIDFPHVVIVGRTLYKDLLKVNNEVGEERVLFYEWGGDRHLKNGEGQNHSKYMVVDQFRVIVGSYNIDPRSRWLNSETIVVYEGADAASPFVNQFKLWLDPNWTIPISYQQALKFEDPGDLKSAFDLIIAKLFQPLL